MIPLTSTRIQVVMTTPDNSRMDSFGWNDFPLLVGYRPADVIVWPMISWPTPAAPRVVQQCDHDATTPLHRIESSDHEEDDDVDDDDDDDNDTIATGMEVDEYQEHCGEPRSTPHEDHDDDDQDGILAPTAAAVTSMGWADLPCIVENLRDDLLYAPASQPPVSIIKDLTPTRWCSSNRPAATSSTDTPRPPVRVLQEAEQSDCDLGNEISSSAGTTTTTTPRSSSSSSSSSHVRFSERVMIRLYDLDGGWCLA